MALPPPKDPIELMGQAYERLLEASVKKIQNQKKSNLKKIIDEAKQSLSDWEELTEEEIEKIADYLYRDIQDAARYIAETGQELKDWLGFEKALLKEQIWQWFSQAADPTEIELLKLKEDAALIGYHSGEVTGPGTLICDQCGEKMHFYQAMLIPQCPKCGGTHFHRA